MHIFKSFQVKIFCTLLFSFIVVGVSIYWLAVTQITEISERYQRNLFVERIETVLSILHDDNRRLKKTGMIEAYQESFQNIALSSLQETFDGRDTRPMVFNDRGDELLWDDQEVGFDKTLLFSSDTPKGSLYEFEDRQGLWVIGRPFAPWQWQVVYAVPLERKREQAILVSRQLAGIIMLVLVVTAFTLFIIISRVTRPITSLTRASVAIAEGDLESKLPRPGNDEIGMLSTSFSKMRDSIKRQLQSLEQEINERTLTEEALRDSERKYRQLVQNANDAILIVQDGYVKFANNKAFDLLGIELEGAEEYHLHSFVHPDDYEFVSDRHQRRLRGEKGLPSMYNLRLLSSDKKQFRVQVNAVMVEWNNKPATLNFIRDMTKQMEMEEIVQQAQKMESIGTLAGGIAHDFNNLLMGIQGRASLLMSEPHISNEAMQHLKSIDTYIESATGLTARLLGFARGGKYQPQPIDLNELVVNTAEMFGRTSKGLRFEYQISTDSLVVEADKSQIEQVLLNLYVNAWQAMPDGGEIKLTTETKTLTTAQCAPHNLEQGEYASITVSDTGSGISPENLEKIFDPFFTTKEKGRGTGLGLASAYGIIQNHDGFITVESTLSVGTVFHIFLPRATSKAVTELNEKPKVYEGTGSILLVDDENVVLEVGKSMLETLGYKVETACSGQEAIDLLAKRETLPDLLVLDMIMPGMDGEEVFNQTRKIYPTLPVLLSSGYSLSGKAAHIMSKGCNGFIQKPFTMSELSQKITAILQPAEERA